MKKQTKNQLFKSVLLLLSVVLLIASAVVVAVATTSASLYHTLTINFESDQVEKCVITYVKDNKGNTETKEVTSGETFEILDGVMVSVVVTPKVGLWPDFAFDNPANAAGVSGRTIKWEEFIADNTVSIVCTDRTYTIHALDLDGKTDVKDKLPGGDDIVYKYTVTEGLTLEALTNGSVKYTSGSEDLIELPVVASGTQIFKGWYIKTSEDSASPITPENGKYYMPKTLTMMTDYMHDQDGIIYVYPKFEPKSASVYREDWVHKETGDDHGKIQLFSSKREEFVGSDISALTLNYWVDDPLDAYKSYKGYLLHTTCDHSKCDGASIRVYDSSKDEYRNTVYRYYSPISYTLTYSAVSGDYVSPETYSYSTPTTISNPTRLGYTFKGWKIEVYNATTETWDVYTWQIPENQPEKSFVFGAETSYFDDVAGTWNDPNAIYASDAQADGSYEIRLEAQWEANKYTITYNWGENVSDVLIQNKNNLVENYGVFEFDKVCFIPNPIRAGYTFMGWELTYTNGDEVLGDTGLTATDGGYHLNGALHAQEITLTASWSVESYKVELDVDGTVVGSITGVFYDAALVVPTDLVVPTKIGYTFVGYYNAEGTKKYINADGTSNCNVWDIDGENGTVTLYAKWEINLYNVTINPIEKVPAGVEITLETKDGTRYDYTGTPISLPYQTEFKIEILMPDGFKIVSWNGTEVAVHSGNVFVSGLISLGAEDVVFFTEARPAAPDVGVGYDIDVNIMSEREIQVNFINADLAKLYEVAISQINDASNLTWVQVLNGADHYAFTDLNPGTTYFVFIRLRETENTLSGIPTVKDKTTRYIAYVKEVETLLKDMVSSTDGDCVKVLVEQIIQEIYDLIPEDGVLPPNFYTLVEEKIAAVEGQIAFARLQDSKITVLQNHLVNSMASGSFNHDNKVLLNNLCASAVADISAATTVEQIEEIYTTAIGLMKAVPVTYLYSADKGITLESLLGLAQNGGITLSSKEDIKVLRRAVSDAIAAGKITADSFITIEEAQKLLDALDVIAAYSFNLINVQPADGDSFIFTMEIPKEFQGRTGLQVVYYNAATGMVELLETTVEGNVLTFRANQVSDFVILADATVDLTNVIIVLGVIALCQLLAIALVLVARNKAKNTVMHASVALPVSLAIYFLPANAELIALGLGIAVIVLQIVLMWLLISSGMIHVFKVKKSTSVRREVTAVVREEDLHADPTSVFDEVAPSTEDVSMEETFATQEESAEEFIDDENFDEELAQELAREQEEEADYYDEPVYEESFIEEPESVVEEIEELYDEEPVEEIDQTYGDEIVETIEESYGEEIVEEITEDIEEIYDDEEFVEQETEPYYSLDEEEDIYAFIQEETERVSDVDTADSEEEDTPYGGDALDGIFGVADVQDGDSGDEAGSDGDESPYGESYESASYEYGETADASYAAYDETENSERAEESGEEALDATAYIVNDEEELSEEEEMYRYDE